MEQELRLTRDVTCQMGSQSHSVTPLLATSEHTRAVFRMCQGGSMELGDAESYLLMNA